MNQKTSVMLIATVSLAASVGRAESPPLRDEPQRRHRILQELGPKFSLHATDHFLVFFDRQRDWAIQRGRLLEKSYNQFYGMMHEVGWPVRPLRHRLVCILLHDRARFVEYARTTDQLTEHWPNGYYSSGTNRIAFYNDATAEPLRKLAAQLRGRQTQLDQLYLRLQGMHAPVRPVERANLDARIRTLQRQLDSLHRTQWLVVERANASKATHEAVHQLAFNSGLQQRGLAYPFWMVEGLATNFEAQDLNRPFGLGFDNPARRTVLRSAVRRNEMVPLEQFVVIVDPRKAAEAHRNLLYAEAWGLFRYLFEHHRPQLMQSFRSYATKPVEGGDALRRWFTDSFGPIDAVQARWMRYLGELRAFSPQP